MMLTTIWMARLEDVETMRDIERDAGAIFAEISMSDVAQDGPLPRERTSEYVQNKRAWIVEVDGRSAGYALADEVDGCGHLEQVSIRPEYDRRGIGTHSHREGRGMGARCGLSRTDPEHLSRRSRMGFRTLSEDELTPGLRALRAHEADHGLNTQLRQFMRLDLGDQLT
jgi:N-acetylglutamate synthase-like GNAT family acetyltransferase